MHCSCKWAVALTNKSEISDCSVQSCELDQIEKMGIFLDILIPPNQEIVDFLPFIDVIEQVENSIVKPLRVGHCVRSGEDG